MVCGWRRPQVLRGAGTQGRAEVTRERLAARAAAPGKQGLGTAALPRRPHRASSPSPTTRTLTSNSAHSLKRPDWRTNPASAIPPLRPSRSLSFSPRHPPRGAVSTLQRKEGKIGTTAAGGSQARENGLRPAAHGRLPTLCRHAPWKSN